MNGFKYQVEQGEAVRYLKGRNIKTCRTPQPQISVTAPKGSAHRALNAELHRVAGLVELHSDGQGPWAVRIEGDHDITGRVILDLADGDAEEVTAGLAVLAAVVAELKGKC